MRSGANADLAAGCQRVVVIAPVVQGFGAIAGLGGQVRALTAQGTEVLVIKPDKAALEAIGRNMLDPARRVAAAQAGHAQAASEAAAAQAIWSQSRASSPER
jgi:NTE family protein